MILQVDNLRPVLFKYPGQPEFKRKRVVCLRVIRRKLDGSSFLQNYPIHNFFRSRELSGRDQGCNLVSGFG
jgi:hypothetical protein